MAADISRAGGGGPPPLSDTEAAICKELAADLQLSPVIAEILFRRGFTTAETARRFLQPQLADLPAPSAMKGLDKAADLLAEAVVQRRQIVIHGDYDVDGITATVLLADFLRKTGLEPICHLPNRLTDEYGLTMKSVAVLAAQVAVAMPALLITVDCGISTPKEVRYAQGLGFTVIITDHHEPPADAANFPLADAVVNPKQAGCAFANGKLAGVGVAFFLLVALRRKLVEKGWWTQDKMPNLRDSLDLAALGTIADVMPLTGVNRVLVRAGLEVISGRGRPGIAALCERALLREELISAENVAYQLGPRINAAGRLGNPQLAADLLLTQDMGAAAVLAEELEAANILRRELEAEVLEAALQQAEQQVAAGQGSLVLNGPDWHPGVIGIIASRMIDRFHLPSLVFTGDSGQENMLKGSGRSVPGLNLHQVLEQCRAWIVHFGGHAMAAGLTVRDEDFAQFRAAFAEAVRVLDSGLPPAGLAIDAVLDERTDFRELAHSLRLLEPFGQGNPEPVFLLRNIRLREVNTLREHLRFAVPLNGGLIKGIGFFMAAQFEAAAEGAVDLAFRLKESSYRGVSRIEVHAAAIFSGNCLS
ncbi:MAG: single-stranded-DNA-specific exonuclease RecJ [Candidatus Electronema sp. V4]|uniref:single-stranded-DNA-specific exonuclease RecJ n=1 Tax=Candidatus Electronema sp. V4 TaxID=3454756 RepID=UPI0040553A03